MIIPAIRIAYKGENSSRSSDREKQAGMMEPVPEIRSAR